MHAEKDRYSSATTLTLDIFPVDTMTLL